MMVSAQTRLKKVYDETINPMEQIDKALETVKAQTEKKYIICQVGGNWCPGAFASPTSSAKTQI